MSKVTGLGAPISVRVTFLPVEVQVLRDEIGEQTAVLATAVAEYPLDSDRVDALQAMHEISCQVPSAGRESFEILAPTPLMADILSGAVLEAAERVHAALDVKPLDMQRVLDRMLTMEALVLTLRDFLAVDGGGLANVWI